MPRKTIALFSSDARELYKADIYRALALPSGYVLHFRYERLYIEPGLLARVFSLKGESATIFFVAGNNISIPPAERQVSLYSIREVTIKDIVNDLNIDSIHFYLELGDFVDATPHTATDHALLAPKTFVSEISVDDGPNKNWSQRVAAISAHFQDLMFFTIQAIKKDGHVQLPFYDSNTRSSEYRLNEESAYECAIAFLDPGTKPHGLEVANGNDAVQLIVPAKHRLGAGRDMTIFNLQTHTLPQKNIICFSHLQDSGATNREAWSIELKWKLTRGVRQAVIFGIASGVAAIGLAVGKLATDNLAGTNYGPLNWILGLVSVAFIGSAAGYLYEFFNKK